MTDNELTATVTGLVAAAILAFFITLMSLIYLYNRADLAFQEKMMSNGYVQVVENGTRLWKPAGVKIEIEKPAGDK